VLHKLNADNDNNIGSDTDLPSISSNSPIPLNCSVS